MVRENSYWVSWYATEENGPFTLNWPWWFSGYRCSDDADTTCTAVRAPSENHAKALVILAHDKPPNQIEWRFVEERPDDWSPFCDRFPRAEWMPDFPRPEWREAQKEDA